jgi:hypothetical protein
MYYALVAFLIELAKIILQKIFFRCSILVLDEL